MSHKGPLLLTQFILDYAMYMQLQYVCSNFLYYVTTPPCFKFIGSFVKTPLNWEQEWVIP